MGDVGDEYRESREALQDRKWSRHDEAMAALSASGIPFEEKANGHCIIAGRFDYWATKGLWIERKTKRRGHGVQSLIKLLKGDLSN